MRIGAGKDALGLARNVNVDNFSAMDQVPAASDKVATPEFSTANLQVAYANLCRGMMGAEEIILDFGFNPNSGGKVLDEPAELSSRIILSIPSAVRLHQLLHALLAKRQEAVQQAQAAASEARTEPGAPPA